MITTIVKNKSKVDTKLICKKLSIFTPILILTPNKLKNTKGMVKMFWPFKSISHTYTHTLPCILHEFQVFYRVLDPFGYQMDRNIGNNASLMAFMNGVQWLTSPAIITGLRVHQLS